jgi:cation transport protein ChaC
MRIDQPLPMLSDEERAENLRATMACAPDHGEVWVFGYGSLMWNPCFSYVERHTGTVRGHARRFCVLSARARGTPQIPGLGLGLERSEDGNCYGVVYRLAEHSLDADLQALWLREMTSGIYQPHWLPVATEHGEVTALTFVVDRGHPQYAGNLSAQEKAAIIVAATGHYGPCREYLARTMQELAALGINEPDFDALYALVNARS